MGNPKSGYCECGSGDLEYGRREDIDDSLGYHFTCNFCGKTGIEWYDVKYSETIMTEDL